jgi:hypothetical protein
MSTSSVIIPSTGRGKSGHFMLLYGAAISRIPNIRLAACLTWRRPLTSLTTMNGRRLSSWLLVGVAIFVVFGHICAAPFHAHAGAVTTHSEDHPESGSDEAAHGGSCEALRADSDVDAPALLPTGIVLPIIGDLETLRTHPTSAPASTSSPPLFLLHAALLI